MEIVLLLLFVGMVGVMLSGQHVAVPTALFEPFPKYGWRLTFVLLVTLVALIVVALSR